MRLALLLALMLFASSLVARAEDAKEPVSQQSESKPADAKPVDADRTDSDKADAKADTAKATKAGAKARTARSPRNVSDEQDSLCLLIESAATSHGIPTAYFARLIWQESRFRADAVGPVTRNGRQALGIAQFMPGTASDRGLLDPFDPVQALPKSAEFLSELRRQFGNLGLAAAAYNAGPRRVREWLDKSGSMPEETRRYVHAITGLTVDEWAEHGSRRDYNEPPVGCRELIALVKRAPAPFIEALESKVHEAAIQPWGVQLSANFDRSRALASYSRLASRYASVLSDEPPMILRTRLRSRGTRSLYQVRVGAGTRNQADQICDRIRRAGGPCMVLKTPRA